VASRAVEGDDLIRRLAGKMSRVPIAIFYLPFKLRAP
jgi:hypothetical protein